MVLLVKLVLKSITDHLNVLVVNAYKITNT